MEKEKGKKTDLQNSKTEKKEKKTVHIPLIGKTSNCKIEFFPQTANCKKKKAGHRKSYWVIESSNCKKENDVITALLEGAMCSQSHQHTALFACDGVHQCVVLCGVWRVSVSVCCGVVWWLQEKKGRGKDTVKQKQKGLFPKPLFPFSLFSTSFSSTLFSLPSTLPPSLPSYPYTHLFFIIHTCVHSW